MKSRWLVDLESRVVNIVGNLLFRKPRNRIEQWLLRLLAAMLPKHQEKYMQDDLVDEDIGFDAEELRQYRESGNDTDV
tara:strand:+ start:348 stop:581 length:234 start_codon:yes stop_codon:yes gene_type:complete